MIGLYRWVVGCLLQPHGINISDLRCLHAVKSGDVVVINNKVCNLKPHLIENTPAGRSFYYLYISNTGMHQYIKIDVDANNRLIAITKKQNIIKGRHQHVAICAAPKTLRKNRWLGKLAGTAQIKIRPQR